MYYGVSYYPEHKNESELRHDINLLKSSGINTVRMGEFAWNRFEPQEGKFSFEWLDAVVQELGEAGIKTIICTPTACPPAWIFFKYPQMAYTDNRGVKRPFGGRRHYCYNNEDYRRHCAVITAKIANHYGKNPYVAGFQIDNEPAQETTGRCTCPVCTQKFQQWLKNKYHTIESFNARSGGVFWAQEYTDFSQIMPPVNTIEVSSQQSIQAFHENPTVRLDFERFCSDSQIEFQDIQTDILKQHTAYPVTTNATGLATNSIDYYKGMQKLDCYAFDFYPSLRDSQVDSFPYAFARGVKKDTPFWVLEFMSGGGHRLGGSGRLQPNPGALKQAVIQSMAHGAEMMLHFQFRTFPFGAEQLNYAIVDMDGIPRRRYREMQETAQLLNKLSPLEQSKFANDTAIIFDYDSHWALRIKPVNDPLFSYINHATQIYKQLLEEGIGADVISFSQSFEAYKVIVLPSAIIMTQEQQQKIRRFVENGGTVISTFLTSVKNEDNVGYTASLPAGLTEVFGVTVAEVEPVFQSSQLEVSAQNGTCGPDKFWSELLSVNENAEIMAKYSQGYKAGEAVVSVNKYGKGFAWYFGTSPTAEALKELLKQACTQAGVSVWSIIPPQGKKVEVIRRVMPQTNADVYFILNFECEDISMNFDKPFMDYLSGEEVSSITLAQNGIAVLQDLEQRTK